MVSVEDSAGVARVKAPQESNIEGSWEELRLIRKSMRLERVRAPKKSNTAGDFKELGVGSRIRGGGKGQGPVGIEYRRRVGRVERAGG